MAHKDNDKNSKKNNQMSFFDYDADEFSEFEEFSQSGEQEPDDENDHTRFARLIPEKLPQLNLAEEDTEEITIIPRLTLPTRWEILEPQIRNQDIQIKTIVRPIREAMNVVASIVDYLLITRGANLLVIRADTGVGKTTFFNTLTHYINDISFNIDSIDIQSISEQMLHTKLWDMKFKSEEDLINLVILEGRETPESLTSDYIQNVLADINRLSRQRKVPLLFVIPTVETEVARLWCSSATKIGDLIPRDQLAGGGSQWYEFPGVSKEQFSEIADETVRALNESRTLTEYSVTPSELKVWSDTSNSIGSLLETLASKVSERRRTAKVSSRTRREKVWMVMVSPEYSQYDRLYHLVNGLVKNATFTIAQEKLLDTNNDNTRTRKWRNESREWLKFLTATTFLDVRIINFPIKTAVAAVQAFGEDSLLDKLKEAKLSDFKSEIVKSFGNLDDIDWETPLLKRKLTKENASRSIGRTNLYRLMRGLGADPTKGGNPESPLDFAQYRFLRDNISEGKFHYYIGLALKYMLETEKFPNLLDVATEHPYQPSQKAPTPDVTVYTGDTDYLLEFHFTNTPIASSQIASYTVNKVEQYMTNLSHLRSLLDGLNE